MLTPIYTIYKSHKAFPGEYTPGVDGWTEGTPDGWTCWETMDEAKEALDKRFDNMRNGLIDALPIKNTLKIFDRRNGIVAGGIYFEQGGVQYLCYVAQLILAKKDA